MVALTIFGGPLKREIIKRAYGMCGQAGWEFELDPEEWVAGLQALNDVAATLPSMPYNAPTSEDDGNAQDESGIAAADVLGVSVMVARLIGPTIGKVPTLGAVQARAERAILAKYNPTPAMQLGRNTIRGAGNRYGRWFGPFLPTDTDPNAGVVTDGNQIVVVPQ